MAADSSPSRSHTCLRPPQCPLRTLQFICPPFSFFHDELRVAETDPKSRRHRRPELLAPLEAGVILTWVHWITPKDGAHDLRRSCARFCHAAGGELEQIQFLLGHVSVVNN